MADFQTSTHRAKWIFSPHDLTEKYKTANQRAIQMLEKFGATRIEVDVDGSLLYPEPQNKSIDNAGKHSRSKPLNIEEEKLLRVFYEGKIQEVCGAFKFPHKIQATALIYFKRFYLQWSVMELHPKLIMLTCIYVACKVEENHVSAEELGKGIEQDHQMILNNEIVVYQSLGFDLIVYAPYRALDGFMDDILDFCQPINDQPEIVKGLHETAKVEVDKTMLTDAPLLFSPGQLALAALRRSNMTYHFLDFDSYLGKILSRQRPEHTVSELTDCLNAIEASVWELKIPAAADMKHIDRKLKSCQNRSSHDEKKREKKSKHRSKKSKNDIPNLLPTTAL